MAEVIEIRIRQVGAEKTARDIQRIGEASDKAASSVEFLARSTQLFIGVQAARELARLSDAYTTLGNRVAVFSSSQDDAAKSVRGLIDVALRSRQSLTAAGEVFQRFSIAAREVGLSRDDILAFTETLLKATTISGATAQEAEGALRQLLQGFSANRLSGQELNSVLEQTPFIARLIAKELGVGVGQLRALANQSKQTAVITREVLIRAFRNGAEEVEAAFAKTNVTFGQAFTNIRTGLEVLVGELGRVGGAAQFLARGVNEVAKAMVTFATDEDRVRVASAGLNFLLVGLAANTLPLLIGGFVRILSVVARFALSLNPIVLGLQLLVAGFTLVKDNVVEFGGISTTIGDIAAVIGTDFVDALKQGLDAAIKFFSFDIESLPFGKQISRLLDQLKELLAVSGILERAAERTRAREAAGATGGSPGATGGGSVLDSKTKNLLAEFQKLEKQTAFLSKETDEFDRKLRDASIQIKDTTDKFGPLIGKTEVTKQRLDALQTTLLNIKRAEFAKELRDFAIELDPLASVTQKFSESVVLLNHALAIGAISAGEYDLALKQLLETQAKALEDLRDFTELAGLDAFQVGLSEGIKQIAKDLDSEVEIVKSGFVSLFEVGTNALEEFAASGKFNFADFAREAIRQIQKIIIQVLILKAIQTGLNLIAGGAGDAASVAAANAGTASTSEGGAIAVTDLATLAGRAAGGPVSGGRPFLVGERGPELFVPPRSGEIVPLGQDSMAPVVNVQVVNVQDPREVVSAISSREGEEVILNVLSRNRGRARAALGA